MKFQDRCLGQGAGTCGRSYHPPGREFNFPKTLAIEFVTELVEAILVVFLLAQASLTSFAARLGFVTLAGILAAITTNISYWNWYGFPTNYTMGYMTLLVVGFICVGVVAAIVLGKRTARSTR